MRCVVLFAATLAFITPCLVAQVPDSVYSQVIEDLNHKEYTKAETTLRLALNHHPRDARALGLMGVVLDAQKQYAEAERYYREALQFSPHSSSLWNNLGNTYLEEGKQELAHAAYQKVVEIYGHDENANFQLARIAVSQEQGHSALHYIGQLSAEDQASVPVQLLRAQALKLAGSASEAIELLGGVLKRSGGDPRVSYSVGMLLVKWKSYRSAEEAFSQAQKRAPGDFDVLYNLGLAALDAGDLSEAEQAFQLALKQRPNDVDTLIGLGRAESLQGHQNRAVTILFQAVRLAPNNPGLLKFLASATAKLGQYSMAASFYGKYLKLRPEDDEARRERAYALALEGRFNVARKDLTAYVQTHPQNAVGLFELGMTQSLQERGQAIQDLRRALALNPRMIAARLELAHLLEQTGSLREAIRNLKIASATQPGNFAASDELGECYLRAGDLPDALASLRKAVSLAPQDSLVLLHYSQALMRAGQQQPADRILDRLKSLEPREGPGGLHPRLGENYGRDAPFQVSPSLAPLREFAAADPQDSELQLLLAKALLSKGNAKQAAEVFQRIKASSSDPKLLTKCGKALLDAKQYAMAQDFLSAAVNNAAIASDSDTRLDLAMAVFHVDGAQKALPVLDKIPAPQRNGDYFLLKAQLLDAMGQPRQAAGALNQAFRLAPRRPELYFQAALFLAKYGQYRQMIKLLTQANQLVPDDPRLQLTLAMAYEMLQRHREALDRLAQMETRWPRWALPYKIQGIVFSLEIVPVKAKSKLQTAIALGADDSDAYFYLAWAIITANRQDVKPAEDAIRKAVALAPEDPYIQSLAGKIAYLEKDYPEALKHLDAALAIWPNMAEAHETLSAVYRAMGEKDKSIQQLKDVLQIKEKMPTANQLPPFPIGSELFSIR
jgi:tetratricopeptide (TPR) repeat protein